MKKLFIALFLIFTTGACIYAQSLFQLQFPVKCQIDKDCWIINYVDDDPTVNWHDYKNGRETYEGHTGTDIAIKNISQMKQGVDVLAAESGFVVATRDEVPDKNALSQDLNQLQNIGCGNRVAIKHSGNFITDYCHMKKGSIKVKKGDFVLAGQKLGQIGMSGLTEFPHLHINVQKNNQFIDPFTGLERYTKGVSAPLWSAPVLKQLAYKPVVVYNVGVSNEIPTLLNIRNEKYKSNQVGADSNMIIVWVDMFHVEANDSVDILVKSPSGTAFIKEHIAIDKSNAKRFAFVGKKKPLTGFPKGNYKAQISFSRQKANLNALKSFNFTVN